MVTLQSKIDLQEAMLKIYKILLNQNKSYKYKLINDVITIAKKAYTIKNIRKGWYH